MSLPPARRRLRILVLSWNYPTAAAPQRGLWAERMCDAASRECDISVIVPTPWVPPFVPVPAVSRFRSIPRQERRGRVDVYFPRVLGSIEYLTSGLDARLASPAVLETARRLHADTPFDLIHAHFIYPDGVVAARIGALLGIPVMTSEHAFWTPWLIDRHRVGAQVARALPGIALVTAVSAFLRRGIDEYAGGRVATAVLGNVVDDRTFAPTSQSRDPYELLYVGLIRRVKRIDVLLRALAEVRETMPNVRLRILSSNAFRAYSSDRREMTRLIQSLALGDAVDLVNGAGPPEVAAAMRRCSFVTVSSSRRETFCTVAAEAMACGTPLILTRCGGPEEFVTQDDGVMVEPDDVSAFAAGIREGFARRDRFDGGAIHDRIVGRFGRDAWTQQAMAVYDRVATNGRPRGQ